MTCSIIYEEMMSLKLDGLLGSDDERYLHAHLVECPGCGPIWTAMQEADAMLWSSAAQPVALPAAFHERVMAQVAMLPVVRPQWEPDTTFAPPVAVPVTASVLPPLTRQLTGELPAYALDALNEWQRRIARYVQGMIAVGLSVAGAAGLLLVLLLSGAMKVEGPMSSFVESTRTFFSAVDTWVRSVFFEVGPGAITVAALVASLLALAGWQVVAGYHHRSTFEQRGNTGYLEAVS
ncbi:MAG: zf-HC2 domain-containing protein [Chloroflexota bacterium]|nr:zf-HC2 domain-containing protein [Chloroflexota bacterium]